MIKKNTKIILEDEKGRTLDNNLMGGIPLSRGEIVHVHDESDKSVSYEVVEKKVDFYIKEKEQIANITYNLRRI